MFKAGQRMRVDALSYTNAKAVLVAPIIHLHGLVLYADRPIELDILAFLKAKGVDVQQIEEDGDKLVRVTGRFKITRTEVQKFLSERNSVKKGPAPTPALGAAAAAASPAVAVADVKDVKETGEAVNFQKQVDARLRIMLSLSLRPVGVEQGFYYERPIKVIKQKNGNAKIENESTLVSRIKNSGLSSGGETSIEAGTSASFGCANIYSANKSVTVTAGDISADGFVVEELNLNTGILGEHVAAIDIKMTAENSIILVNVLERAKKEIALVSKGSIGLGLDPLIAWTNASAIPSLTFGYGEDIANRNLMDCVRSELAAAEAAAPEELNGSAPKQ